jgi:hypothetical protein
MLSRRAPEILEVTLRMQRPQDLFMKPDITPLSAAYQDYNYTSGIEFIAGQLYAGGKVRPVHATIELPVACLEAGLESRLGEAVGRYCRGRLLAIGQEISAWRWRSLRSLVFGIVALIVLVGGSRLVYNADSAWFNVLADGMVIGGWVACWFPLDTLLFTIRHQELDREIYRQLLSIEITVRPSSSSS